MIFYQRERAEMQTGAEGDAVNAGIERCTQTHAQGLARRIHGELFHAVDEDHAVATLGRHRPAHVVARSLFQHREIEMHGRLVAARDVGLVLLELGADETGVETPVRDRLHHGVGDVADAAEARDFERQLGSRDIHAHAADDDGHQFSFSESQAEIVYAFHVDPW
ncbi:MAG: hypothetical protein H6R47_728 [Proteobacteria bacterium]|nr:hypothetical protein [Pseudomonadota bacterium]